MSRVYDSIRSAVLPLVPQPLFAAQLVNRRAPRWRQAGVIFIHIPKNGGTSINTALYGQFMGHYTAAEVRRWAPRCAAELPMLAVARNPWARLLSAYRFVRLGRALDTVEGVAVERPERYALDTFRTFERFVLEWLPGRDLSKEDPVFRPQSHFVMDRNDRLIVDHVGRVEDLSDTVEFLERRLGRTFAFGRINRTGAAAEHYQDLYTPEMRDVAERAYAADSWMGYRF